MFILSTQRDDDSLEAFRRYRRYLRDHESTFPVNAYRLATSDWWFNFNDRRGPHDSWLKEISIVEPGAGDRAAERSTSVLVELFGAYQDRVITLSYTNVSALLIDAVDIADGHGDWRYDEFRVSDDGRLIHEIEWSRLYGVSHWRIEADDISYASKPVGEAI